MMCAAMKAGRNSWNKAKFTENVRKFKIRSIEICSRVRGKFEL